MYCLTVTPTMLLETLEISKMMHTAIEMKLYSSFIQGRKGGVVPSTLQL